MKYKDFNQKVIDQIGLALNRGRFDEGNQFMIERFVRHIDHELEQIENKKIRFIVLRQILLDIFRAYNDPNEGWEYLGRKLKALRKELQEG